jgi:hypothetical protein
VRETERRAKQAGSSDSRGGNRQVVIHPDLADLIAAAEDALTAALGHDVKVSSRGGRCRVEFRVEDPREALELAARISEVRQSRAA